MPWPGCIRFHSPLAFPIVKSNIGDLKRMLAKPTTKKVPITVEILEHMV